MPQLNWELTTPVIEALLARLRDLLPARLAERADGQSVEVADLLKEPEQYLDHAPPPDYLQQLPAIGILDLTSDITDDTGSSATGVHQLGVVIYLADPDNGVLARALRWYASAILAAVMDDRGLPDEQTRSAAWGIVCNGVRWGDTFTDEESPRTYLSWVTVLFTFKREEI